MTATADDLRERLAANIRRRIRDADHRRAIVRELAEATITTEAAARRNLERWLRGDHWPRVEPFAALAKALRCDPAELLAPLDAGERDGARGTVAP